jgi:hypothetical protein
MANVRMCEMKTVQFAHRTFSNSHIDKTLSMLKKTFLLLVLAATALTVQAQDEEEQEPVEKGFKKENLFFGGNFGLSFGNYTLINVSPQVGYRFSRYFSAGTGVNFIYTSSKFFGYRENYGVAGLNVFGRAYPIQQIFVQLQPEANYTWGKQKYDNQTEFKLDGKVVPSLLAGAGVAIPVGQRGAMLVMVQYDVLQQARSPYGNNPFVSIGFNF